MHPKLEIRCENSALTVHFHALVPSAWAFDGSTITVRIPMTWKRHDGRKVIVAPGGGDAWPDDTLIRALARAHRWKGREEGPIGWGTGRSRECHSFVNRLLRLTLLAPDIVEAILEGRPPKGYGTGGVDRVKGK